MSRPLLVMALLLLAAPAARADQFQYLDLPQAEAAMRRLHGAEAVQRYCAPCGDRRAVRAPVDGLGIGRVWAARGSARVYRDGDARGYWQLELADGPVDLAYVYVRDGARWRNLAGLLGLQPVQVPRVLPPAVVDGR